MSGVIRTCRGRSTRKRPAMLNLPRWCCSRPRRCTRRPPPPRDLVSSTEMRSRTDAFPSVRRSSCVSGRSGRPVPSLRAPRGDPGESGAPGRPVWMVPTAGSGRSRAACASRPPSSRSAGRNEPDGQEGGRARKSAVVPPQHGGSCATPRSDRAQPMECPKPRHPATSLSRPAPQPGLQPSQQRPRGMYVLRPRCSERARSDHRATASSV